MSSPMMNAAEGTPLSYQAIQVSPATEPTPSPNAILDRVPVLRRLVPLSTVVLACLLVGLVSGFAGRQTKQQSLRERHIQDVAFAPAPGAFSQSRIVTWVQGTYKDISRPGGDYRAYQYSIDEDKFENGNIYLAEGFCPESMTVEDCKCTTSSPDCLQPLPGLANGGRCMCMYSTSAGSCKRSPRVFSILKCQ